MSLRSVYVDGSARGRPPGTPSDLTMLRAGRGVFFTTRADAGATTFHRMSLDDGEITRLGMLTRDLPIAVAAAAEALFTSLMQGEIARYDLTSGDLVRFDHSGVTRVAGCSPDGRFVAVQIGPQRLEVVRVDDRARVAEITQPRAVAFVDDGSAAVVRTRQGLVLRIDLATGRAAEAPAMPDDPSAALRTPDGRHELQYASPHFELRDVIRGGVTTWHDGHESPVTSIAWSRDGAMLATREVRGGVRVSRPRAQELVWTLEGPSGEPAALCFSADQRTLYLCAARGFRAWDLATAAQVFDGPNLRQRAIAMTTSDDGAMLAVVGDESRLRVIDLGGTPRRVMTTKDAPPPTRGEVALHHDVAFDGAQSIRCLSATPRIDGAAPGRLHRSLVQTQARWFDLAGQEIARVVWPPSRGPYASIHDDLDALVGATDDGLVVVTRVPGALAAHTRTVCNGLTSPTPLCAGCGVVLSLEGDASERALTVRSLRDGTEVGRVACSRRCVRGAMAPVGGLVAVAYADGGVEVFALDP